MTWRETRARIREDRERLRAYLDADGGGRTVPLWMTPSFQAVVLQRLSHHFYPGGNRLLGRFFWPMNLMLTGGDISMICDIGGGPGLPVLGDGVELGWGAFIMGPIRVGNGARIGALSIVVRDVPDGGEVMPGERQMPRGS